MANVDGDILEEPLQKCGSVESMYSYLMIHKDPIPKRYHNAIAKCTVISTSNGYKTHGLDDCESVIQLCQNSYDCRPLFDGKTSANIIFQTGIQTNNLCPKIVLQLGAKYGRADCAEGTCGEHPTGGNVYVHNENSFYC